MATWLVIGETTYIGDIPADDLVTVSFALPEAVAQLTVETSSTAGMYVNFPGPGAYEGLSPCVRPDVPEGDGIIEIYGGAEGQTDVWVRVSTDAAAPVELGCFWAPESVVGLSKVCTAAAPVGDVLSFVPYLSGEGEYIRAGGAAYGFFSIEVGTAEACSPEFLAALTSGGICTITGISYIRPWDGSGPAELGALYSALPESLVWETKDWVIPISDGSTYDGYFGAYAVAGQSNKYYYGRVDVGGQTFYGLFAVGGGT